METRSKGCLENRRLNRRQFEARWNELEEGKKIEVQSELKVTYIKIE